jgi:GNAT superfamily N-acetyltransferase
VDNLDRYLQQFARQDMRRDVTVAYVLNAIPQGRVAGYYTLCAWAMRPDDLPEAVAGRYPRYPELPAVLLGRLAVDVHYQDRQLGRYLLFDALERAYRWSRTIAAMAVVVDAIDDRAAAFYQHYSFSALPQRPSRLYLLMATAAELRRP